MTNDSRFKFGSFCQFDVRSAAIVELGDNFVGNPIEHASKAQLFQMQSHCVSRSLRKQTFVEPDPHIAQQKPNHDEQQPQMGIASAGEDSCLTPLAVTGLNAEPCAVGVPNVLWRPVDAPSSSASCVDAPGRSAITFPEGTITSRIFVLRKSTTL